MFIKYYLDELIKRAFIKMLIYFYSSPDSYSNLNANFIFNLEDNLIYFSFSDYEKS